MFIISALPLFVNGDVPALVLFSGDAASATGEFDITGAGSLHWY